VQFVRGLARAARATIGMRLLPFSASQPPMKVSTKNGCPVFVFPSFVVVFDVNQPQNPFRFSRKRVFAFYDEKINHA
jgi:hypothetical protein